MKNIFLFIIFSILLSACIEIPNTFSKLPPGEWRAVLKLTDPEVIEPPENLKADYKVTDYFELPFNLEVYYDESGKLKVNIINGAEKIAVDKIHYGRDPKTAKDTLRLDFVAFDSYIDAFYEENIIEGRWHVNNRDGYSIPFIAFYGQNHRFDSKNQKSTIDFSGIWQTEFEYDNPDKAYPAIAEFKQNDGKLEGTFETETGDFRFLAGNAYGSKLRLSVFDGSHAFLFHGEFENDTIYGEFRSGKHYKSKWKAFRNPEAALKNPDDMTKHVEAEVIDFEFESTDGSMISLTDENLEGKVKLINIMGTWCPNCKDEVEFLKEIQSRYKEDQLAIISIAFEKYRDEEKAFDVLRNYKKHMNIEWPLLLGGYANKTETGNAFGFLDKIYSYPTLLMINSDNEIVNIHTGFYGPASSKHQAFKTAFINKLNTEIKK